MPIAASDLILYASASRPITDVALTGGAIDATIRPFLTQLTSNAKLAAISDGADVRTMSITGRLPTGSYASEDVVLTGAGEVLSVNTYERILSATLNATSATRTVTLKQGAGGTTVATIPINEAGVCALFINSASAVGAVTRTEKEFWKNAHATITLNAAKVTLTADPSARVLIGLALVKDGVVTIANRLAVPAGVTFVDDGVAIDVPGTTLEAGSAIGVWVQEVLQAADTAFRTTFTTQLSGTTI